MKKILAIPAVAAVASFAGESTAPAWLSDVPTFQQSGFGDVIGTAATFAVAVVVAVAGVRVLIKLINRGAGK